VVSAQLNPADIYDRKDGAASVVDVEWEGSDLDDDELNASVTWFVDGAEVEGNPDGTLDGRSFAKGQAIRAEVIVSDGTLDSAPLLTDPVLVLNSRPAITGVVLSPSALFEGTTASALVSGWSDEDGDPEGYQYRWLVNGRDAGTGPTLTGAAWKKGDRVVVEVTPFDGEEAGTPVSSTSVTVQNTLPTLASVTLSPDPVRTDDTLTATAGTTTDDDGDTVSVTYAWTVNGTAAGTGATLAGTAFKKGDTVEVTATPNDGTGSGTAVKASLRVSNTAPVVTSLTLSPSTVRTNDTIGATASASDADSDALTTTITWSVNGKVVSTGTSLAGSFFSKNDKVDASAVASDGTDSSVARVASVTIANTAPTTPGIAFSPSAPGDADNIQCTIATASTDADGDTLTYAYSWTRNGSAFTGTTTTTRSGDTVPASSTTGGDTFVCNVTASDGTATSAAATRSVTVTGATVPGFSGVLGPTFSGWTQCEGYLDKASTEDLPTAWGNDCVGSSYNKVRLVCGASSSSYRYIDVKKNIFKSGLTAYSETGLITDFRNQSGTALTIPDNTIYAESNNPNLGRSWWQGGNGCGETNTNITFNNVCTWEASNCFGQGLAGDRYVWVYVAP
jgi:hypothetical protein